MDLTMDIIRDVLICIKNNCEFCTDEKGHFRAATVNWKVIYENEMLDSKYDIDDIKYCILKLNEGGLIRISKAGTNNRVFMLDINDVTWEGHEFLKNVEDDSFWNMFKSKMGEGVKFSVSVLAKLSAEAAFEYAKSKLGII